LQTIATAGRSGRGIFFDLDGTLADSLGAMRHVFGQFAASFGRVASEAEFAASNGPPVPIFVARLKHEWALPASLDELLARYRALIDAAYLDVAPAPGATATLETAFRHGWTVSVVTSNTGARTRTWLARTGLAPFVNVIVGGDEVVLGKPNPEPYRVALARSACNREASIAVEDSLPGVRSALAAGLRSFVVAPRTGESHANPPIDWPDPVRLIAALDELIPELGRKPSRRFAGEH